MKYTLRYTGEFKRSLKRCLKRGYDEQLLTNTGTHSDLFGKTGGSIYLRCNFKNREAYGQMFERSFVPSVASGKAEAL